MKVKLPSSQVLNNEMEKNRPRQLLLQLICRILSDLALPPHVHDYLLFCFTKAERDSRGCVLEGMTWVSLCKDLEDKVSSFFPYTDPGLSSEAGNLINAKLFFLRAQIKAFYHKDETLSGVQAESEALGKFLAVEEHNASTNRRLCSITDTSKPLIDVTSFQFLERVRILVASVLGKAPLIEDLVLSMGPGACSGVTKRNATPQRKLSAGFAVGSNLCHDPLFPLLLQSMPHLCVENAVDDTEEHWVVEVDVRDADLVFVPKNIDSKRTIVVQPLLDSLMQQGLRKVIEQRLKHRTGIDLSDQTEYNRALARHGARYGHLATIDLSSASDTISYELVRYCVPEDWFSLLRACRSNSVRLPSGQMHSLSMFSSMGNAVTFPLETLLFWAITKATAATHSMTLSFRGQLVNSAVFGDDIICPIGMYPSLLDNLDLCGFIPNQAKSFGSGPFRESCGRDYYLDFLVRPVYLRNGFTNFDLIRMFNYFRSFESFGEPLRRSAGFCYSSVPRALQGLKGEPSFGDSCLHWDSWKNSNVQYDRQRHSWFCWIVTREGLSEPSVFPGDHITPLYLASVGSFADNMMLKSGDGRILYPKPGSGLYKVTKTLL